MTDRITIMMMLLFILVALAACVSAFEISFLSVRIPGMYRGPPVERHGNGEMFPADESKIHPAPTFRFSRPQMEAQKLHPSFLPATTSASAIDSSSDKDSNTFTRFAAVAPKQRQDAQQQQLSVVSSREEESLSEYEKQLQQFGRQVSMNGKINGNDGSFPQ